MTARLRGALMVCGTTSDAGKSRVVTGLCRALARRGITVAPFKAQNMALNSFVTRSGHEIGRAQGVQALAAGVEPEVDMNPILLKPSSDRSSQVIVLGEAIGHLDAAAYHATKPALRDMVLAALDRLRARFDVVLLEGAGSPAEINLLDGDLVNLWLADAAAHPGRGRRRHRPRRRVRLPLRHRCPAPRPPPLLRAGLCDQQVPGRSGLLAPGLDDLEARTGIPTLGVLPWVEGLHLDAEDSLALRRPWGDDAAGTGTLDVCVVRFPRISNFTDTDALSLEPDVSVRYVTHAGAFGDPDLVILPGTKATVADLAWLRARGFDRACGRSPRRPRSWASAAATRCSASPSTTTSRAARGRSKASATFR